MGILVLCDKVGSYAVTSDGALLPTHPHPSSLPVVREKFSRIVATMYISHPTTSGFNFPFLHFNPKKPLKSAILSFSLFTHSLIHLFIYLSFYSTNWIFTICQEVHFLRSQSLVLQQTRLSLVLGIRIDDIAFLIGFWSKLGR